MARGKGRGCWRARNIVLAWIAMAMLASCGGGGSSDGGDSVGIETLTVSFSYSGEAALFESSTITPVLTGFGGHSPHCALASGSLPAGMSLASDCRISGIPEELGGFNFVVRVGASGVSNTLDFSVGFAVFGPSVLYSFPGGWALGEHADVSPMNVFWFPTPGTTVAYGVRSGALPAGLTVDAATGRVSGVVSEAGVQSFRIGVTVTSNGKTASLTQDSDVVTGTSVSGALYPDDLLALLGTAVSVVPAPTLPAGATLQFSIDSTQPPGTPLPTGLVLDATTGRLSGTALRPQDRTRFAVSIHVQYNGISSTQLAPLWIEARSPVIVFYGQVFGLVDYPVRFSPSIYGNGVPTPTGATYSYRVNAQTPLPLGMVIDATTGEITGMTASALVATFLIDVHALQMDGSSYDITVPIDMSISP